MPHGRSDDCLAMWAYKIRHVGWLCDRGIVLQPLKRGWGKDPIEITAQKLSGAVLLIG